jgi:hypothetical protein
MLDLHRLALTFVPVVLLFGCFEDPIVGDGENSGDSSGDGDGDGDGDPGDGDGDGDGDPGDGDGDGDAQLGPQLVSSFPATGEQQAGIEGFFLLTFDRVVSASDATGKILASQGGAEPVPVVIMPCPNLDPACLAGLYPVSFAPDGDLPSDTVHQIIVEADFPDTDGLTNANDQVVDFRTFFYQSDWFQDAGSFEEVGGIAYHPQTEALFVSVHDTNVNPQGPIIRRIAIPGGNPQPAVSVAMPMQMCCGPWSYGLDRTGDQLFSSMSYGAAVAVLNIAGAGLDEVEIIAAPPLAAPYDTLDEVDAVARASDGRFLFAFGTYFGGPDRIGVVQRDVQQQWSLFNDGKDLWEDDGPGTTLAIGLIANIEYLFVHNADTIYQFRLSDNELVQEHVLEEITFDPHMQVEGNRLFFGDRDGLIVYQVDANGFTELARRGGLDAGRFAVRMADQTAHVYYAEYRGDPIIGYTRIDL